MTALSMWNGHELGKKGIGRLFICGLSLKVSTTQTSFKPVEEISESLSFRSVNTHQKRKSIVDPNHENTTFLPTAHGCKH